MTWEYFAAGHFANGDSAPEYQPEGRHSVVVDLLTPDFNSMETIGTMLQTLAQSIARRTQMPLNKIFVNHCQACSGMVFDDGDVVMW